MDIKAAIKNGRLWVGFALEDLHSVKVALAECPCKAPKSNAAADIRAAILEAIKKGERQ